MKSIVIDSTLVNSEIITICSDDHYFLLFLYAMAIIVAEPFFFLPFFRWFPVCGTAKIHSHAPN
ncbi:hypothetical protein BDV27DRAFT_99680 [Aspergillus caelatus]|uniref:Uncharacterized protein n=1 Tax=Aspergillus caelatus TaxID=61420 RepID=A0A5N7A7G1_9EURO|nr:uncharacterized protein BDV27DRAFT_99680 [Aspergillus caelatus]KAE8365787.1 hypothetical protein BDV27DRAFT_99680 [Aspergillus caelatus]